MRERAVAEKPLPIPVPIAWAVVALCVPYVALNTLFPGPVVSYSGGLVIAGLALALLLRAGATPSVCGLRILPLSRQGALLLLLLSAFIPAALLLGRGQPFSVLDDLIYAPASALSQELYFRSALFVALRSLLPGRFRAALVVQAACFAIWHIRAFTVVAALPALGVLFVTFLAGLLWGLQVARDRTILYAVVQHTLFLIVQ